MPTHGGVTGFLFVFFDGTATYGEDLGLGLGLVGVTLGAASGSLRKHM